MNQLIIKFPATLNCREFYYFVKGKNKKRIILYSVFILTIVYLSFTSCKKENPANAVVTTIIIQPPPPPTFSTTLGSEFWNMALNTYNATNQSTPGQQDAVRYVWDPGMDQAADL